MSEQAAIVEATPAPVSDATPSTDAPLSDPTETEVVEVDTSEEDWGDALEPSVASPAATPLPPDAPEKEGADKIEVAKVDDAPPEIKATEEVKPDAPKVDAEEEGRKGKLSFEDHYLNPAKPASEVVDYLEGRSPSRYAELELTMLKKRLERPDEMVQALFDNDQDAYGKLALAVYEAHPDYFLTKATGKETTLDAVNKALDFHAKYADRAAEFAAGDLEFSDDEIAEVRPFFSDKADKMEAINVRLKEAKANAPAPEPVAKQVADPKSTDSQGLPVLTPEADAILDAGLAVAHAFLLDKLAKQFGLEVTDAEKESAPAVAALKAQKQAYMLNGEGELKPFNGGLNERFKDDKEFKEVIKNVVHFAMAGEKQNALNESKKLNPFMSTYADERAAMSGFKAFDGPLDLATRFPNLSFEAMGDIVAAHHKSQPKPAVRVPGSPSTSSSRPAPTSEMDEMDQMLEDDAIARAGSR